MLSIKYIQKIADMKNGIPYRDRQETPRNFEPITIRLRYEPDKRTGDVRLVHVKIPLQYSPRKPI